ncbi:hypothetical protein GALL_270360 [mine drainage metagenome]|uniref:Uncharacterized protein n=1 Tax=mine drainage metagenome TaxID=410659 RepID=A0A1J5R550_9ZZZZ
MTQRPDTTPCRPPLPVPPAAGVGLRYRHHEDVLENGIKAAWWEVHPENYMAGAPLEWLERIRRDRPVSLHATGLSLGSAEGVEAGHLERLAELCHRIDPGLVSDHLSWSTTGKTYLADLIPLPMTEECLDIVCRNVDQVQNRLKRTILVENPSAYLRFQESPIPEPLFLDSLARRTGCGLLLDINNIFVSGRNLGFDPVAYLESIHPAQVKEFHLAGHAVREIGGHILRIDDHGSPVDAEVWPLFAQAVARIGRRPTLIEWDTDIPPLGILLQEAEKADLILQQSDEVRYGDSR